jgi:predicted nucleic acid-binding protein
LTKVFLDTNVVVDLLGKRAPFFNAAAEIATLGLEKHICLHASSISFVTVFYLLRKYEPESIVVEKLKKFAVICTITPVDSTIVFMSLNAGMKDFEDSVQLHSALSAGVTLIITRNIKDFKNVALPVVTPDEFLAGFLK